MEAIYRLTALRSVALRDGLRGPWSAPRVGDPLLERPRREAQLRRRLVGVGPVGHALRGTDRLAQICREAAAGLRARSLIERLARSAPSRHVQPWRPATCDARRDRHRRPACRCGSPASKYDSPTRPRIQRRDDAISQVIDVDPGQRPYPGTRRTAACRGRRARSARTCPNGRSGRRPDVGSTMTIGRALGYPLLGCLVGAVLGLVVVRDESRASLSRRIRSRRTTSPRVLPKTLTVDT